jgi:hypothetical protein
MRNRSKININGERSVIGFEPKMTISSQICCQNCYSEERGDEESPLPGAISTQKMRFFAPYGRSE